MIKIYNKKLAKEILIQDNGGHVIVSPLFYDSTNPHFKINLGCIDFFTHAEECEDCGAFLKAFGTDTFDWYLEYNGTPYRLNLKSLGKTDLNNNHLAFHAGYYFSGTEMKLNIDNDTVESLEGEMKLLLNQEEYEKCVYVRDKLIALKESIQ